MRTGLRHGVFRAARGAGRFSGYERGRSQRFGGHRRSRGQGGPGGQRGSRGNRRGRGKRGHERRRDRWNRRPCRSRQRRLFRSQRRCEWGQRRRGRAGREQRQRWREPMPALDRAAELRQLPASSVRHRVRQLPEERRVRGAVQLLGLMPRWGLPLPGCLQHYAHGGADGRDRVRRTERLQGRALRRAVPSVCGRCGRSGGHRRELRLRRGRLFLHGVHGLLHGLQLPECQVLQDQWGELHRRRGMLRRQLQRREPVQRVREGATCRGWRPSRP